MQLPCSMPYPMSVSAESWGGGWSGSPECPRLPRQVKPPPLPPPLPSFCSPPHHWTQRALGTGYAYNPGDVPGAAGVSSFAVLDCQQCADHTTTGGEAISCQVEGSRAEGNGVVMMPAWCCNVVLSVSQPIQFGPTTPQSGAEGGWCVRTLSFSAPASCSSPSPFPLGAPVLSLSSSKGRQMLCCDVAMTIAPTRMPACRMHRREWRHLYHFTWSGPI